MPIANAGTLIENVVLIESLRVLCDEAVSDSSSIEFINSFTMAPRSPWTERLYAGPLKLARRQMIEANFDSTDVSGEFCQVYARSCLALSYEGPSGALLAAILLSLKKKRARFWLNDSGFYQSSANTGNHNIDSIAAEVLPNDLQPRLDLVCSATPYPTSLVELKLELSKWRQSSNGRQFRIGYLDPNRYCAGGARHTAATSSADHCEWLEMLNVDLPSVVMSVHFSANCNQPLLRKELQYLYKDASERGYVSNTFSNSYLTTTISINSNDSKLSSLEIMNRACSNILSAWDRWRTVSGQGKMALTSRRYDT